MEFDGLTTYNPNSEFTCSFDDLEGYSFTTILLIFILSITVIVFSVIVVYYNIHVSA